ncbi:MAG TPA: sigma factor [Kofleriaceae bacterium]|nr:sigma factor [Kofleriaceae bacterium]
MTGEAERARLERAIGDAWRARAWQDAATALIAGYGPEILRYLLALAREADTADEAFSQFCENVWLGLPSFRGESTFRVWAYAVARFAWTRTRRGARRRRRHVPLSEVPSVELAADAVRTRTAEYLRTDARDRVAELRARLDPDDHSLLILRVNRRLAWNDIARALAPPDEPLPEPAVAKRAAALRKRYQRIKDELRAAVRT